MNKQYEIPDELRSTLEIFVLELERHINFFKEIISEEENIKTSLQTLEDRFHMIRGGAGFLGLEDMQEDANQAEKICQQIDLQQLLDQSLADELSKIVNDLSEKLESLRLG